MDVQTARLHELNKDILNILIETSEHKVTALKDLRALMFDIENRCGVEMEGKVQTTQFQDATHKQIGMLKQVLEKIGPLSNREQVLQMAQAVEETQQTVNFMHQHISRFIGEQMAKVDEAMKRG